MDKKIFKKLRFIPILLPAIALTGCSNINTKEYTVVAPDNPMTESLAIMGYTPSVVTSDYFKKDYNDFPNLRYENISYASNDEKLLTDQPKIIMGYSDNPTLQQKMDQYGGHYIGYPKINSTEKLQLNSKITEDSNNLNNSKNVQTITSGWSSVKAFWKQLNGLFKTPLVDDVDAAINKLESEFNQRVSTLKTKIQEKYGFGETINISMWGQTSGADYDVGVEDFARYGYDTGQIDWLFGSTNSLGFKKAYPSSNDIYFGVHTGQQYNTLRWMSNGGTIISQEDIQKNYFFASTYSQQTSAQDNTTSKNDISHASDLVFVKYDTKGANDPNIQKIKAHFKQMVNTTNSQVKSTVSAEDRVIIIPTNFSFYQYSPITWDWCLNELYNAMDLKTVDNSENQNNVTYLKDLSTYKNNLKPLSNYKNMIK